MVVLCAEETTLLALVGLLVATDICLVRGLSGVGVGVGWRWLGVSSLLLVLGWLLIWVSVVLDGLLLVLRSLGLGGLLILRFLGRLLGGFLGRFLSGSLVIVIILIVGVIITVVVVVLVLFLRWGCWDSWLGVGVGRGWGGEAEEGHDSKWNEFHFLILL
jgi:hypothetical protein